MIVPTATYGHDNVPGDPMTVKALLNECKRRPRVEVRENHDSTEWEEATLTAYAPLYEVSGVVFTVAIVRGGYEYPITVAQDRIRFRYTPLFADGIGRFGECIYDTESRCPNCDQKITVVVPVDGSGAYSECGGEGEGGCEEDYTSDMDLAHGTVIRNVLLRT